MSIIVCDTKVFTIPKEIAPINSPSYSVFTTFLVDQNSVKGLTQHINRLQNNIKELFGVDVSCKEILENIKAFIKNSNKPSILLRVTAVPQDFSLSNPNKISNVHIMVTGRDAVMHSKNTKYTLQTVEMNRPLAHCKTGDITAYLSARKTAQQKGFTDALFTHNGYITEGPTWNIFFGKGDTLFFPKNTKKILLEGVTQQLLQKNIPAHYSIEYSNIALSDIPNFEYACSASSGIGIASIACINSVLYDTDPCKNLQNIYHSIPEEQVL